jgi:hypothetical protein
MEERARLVRRLTYALSGPAERIANGQEERRHSTRHDKLDTHTNPRFAETPAYDAWRSGLLRRGLPCQVHLFSPIQPGQSRLFAQHRDIRKAVTAECDRRREVRDDLPRIVNCARRPPPLQGC